MLIRSMKHESNVAHYTISRVQKSYTSLKNIIETFIPYSLSNLEWQREIETFLWNIYPIQTVQANIVTKISFMTNEYESIS